MEYVLTALLILGICYCMILYAMAKDRDLKIQKLLDDAAQDAILERFYRHPLPAEKVNNIITVDFTECVSYSSDSESDDGSQASAVKFKLVYDEALGIYYKAPR